MIFDEIKLLKNLIKKLENDRNIFLEDLLIEPSENTHTTTEYKAKLVYSIELLEFYKELLGEIQKSTTSEEQIDSLFENHGV